MPAPLCGCLRPIVGCSADVDQTVCSAGCSADVDQTVCSAGCSADVDQTVCSAGCSANVDQTVCSAGCSADVDQTVSAHCPDRRVTSFTGQRLARGTYVFAGQLCRGFDTQRMQNIMQINSLRPVIRPPPHLIAPPRVIQTGVQMSSLAHNVRPLSLSPSFLAKVYNLKKRISL